MRLVVSSLNVIAMLVGTFWVTQGTGVVRCGVMAGDINWAYFGVGLFSLALCTHAQLRA